MPESLDMFMWGYQPFFRRQFARIAAGCFSDLRADLKPTVCLVGVRREDADGHHPVCLEPDRESPSLAPFDGLEGRIREIVATHPDQSLWSSDPVHNSEMPGRIRADSIRRAVSAVFEEHGAIRGRCSFVSRPIGIGHYDVVAVLTFTRSEYERHQLTQTSVEDGRRTKTVTRGLPDAVVGVLLDEARLRLQQPDPGLGYWDPDRDEMLRRAGRFFMSGVALRIGNPRAVGALFDILNAVSVLPYEGENGSGSLILAPTGHQAVTPLVEIREPIPLGETRWARKALQMTSPELCAVSDGVNVTALAPRPAPQSDEDLFVIDFRGAHRWDLKHGGTILMEVRDGVPHVRRPRVDATWFKSNLSRVILGADVEAVWAIVDAAAQQKHGTIIVVSEKALEEATRLRNEGTLISPVKLDPQLVERITGIDGAVMIDPSGVCHAIGVILDGRACPDGTPSRGARFNSALRYVATTGATIPTLAVIVSEDGYIDVRPMLRPQVSRAWLHQLFATARDRSTDGNDRGLAECLQVIDEHRFYLDQTQCDDANEMSTQLGERTQAARMIWLDRPLFVPDAELTEEYFE